MQRLTIAQSGDAAEVLARAFADDPLWVFLLPNHMQRRLLARQAFRATVPFYARNGQVYGVGTPLQGVAIWRSPWSTSTGVVTLLNASLLTLLFSPFARVLRRAIPIFANFERMRLRYVTEPHYYLSTIGVIPPAQGTGRASQLIKPIVAQADAEGCAMYTETMTPANVPIYVHYGFVCRERYDVPNTPLSMWALYRPGRP